MGLYYSTIHSSTSYLYSNFSPRWFIFGARGARQPITLVIFARCGGALLVNALATTSVNRKEAFAFLLVLLFVSKRLEQLDTDGIGTAQRILMPRVGRVSLASLA